jgi:hypothetical protein
VTLADGLSVALEEYFDASPRSAADVETVGPFTLFVGRGAWGYYARPCLGQTATVTVNDVEALLQRQRALDVPQEIEWQPGVTPSLADACRGAGMAVHTFALMAHDGSHPADGAGDPGVSIAGPDDDLAALLSVQQQGFGGAEQVDPGAVEVLRRRVMAGTTRVAVGGDGAPVCVGMHQPIGLVSEVVGVATLPAQRRRGWAGRVTRALMADARELGVGTVFLCAADESVANVYRRVGFRQVGLVCAAEAH